MIGAGEDLELGKTLVNLLKVSECCDFQTIQKNGRGDRIRTYDFLLPKQAHYRAVLRPDELR